MLRQDPDVILVGELRDLDTISVALTAAETGHLVFATLHTSGAIRTLNRVVGVFPADQQDQVRSMVSESLRAVISQRLVPLEGRKGRVAAVEVMINSPLVSDLIFKGEVSEIKEIMKKSRELGMQTFDQHLFDLYEASQISYEDALRNADSVNDLRLNIKLNGTRIKRDVNSGIGHLDLV